MASVIFPPRNFTAPEGAKRIAYRGAASLVFPVSTAENPAGLVCKRLSARAAASEEARAALVREGEILEALGGRGAPRFVARGTDDAGPYVVMEALAMAPLGARVPDAEFAARVAVRAFAVLAEVHRADLAIVHGDLSPANVLASRDASRAAIVDFGLARWRGGAPNPGPFRGTLAYAAPEVARGEPIDARADLFAMAATLLFVASGEHPRADASAAAALVDAGERPALAWARRASTGLPRELGRALLQCVAFDLGARPNSAADVVRALESTV